MHCRQAWPPNNILSWPCEVMHISALTAQLAGSELVLPTPPKWHLALWPPSAHNTVFNPTPEKCKATPRTCKPHEHVRVQQERLGLRRVPCSLTNSRPCKAAAHIANNILWHVFPVPLCHCLHSRRSQQTMHAVSLPNVVRRTAGKRPATRKV